ncbi:CHAP domain-containing protein [Actinopolyspora saharensis]|uniref:CHAP domain-containing protein n=1 Tax=Actinopolyspora saharensis TaxID=995062 RepID=UPI003F67EAC3
MSNWEKAGVNVDHEEFSFTGDVYATGQTKGTAYDSTQLDSAKPGDVLLFGTSPAIPDSSHHIGVVEKIQGEKVTLIEGNTGDNPDRVMSKTHELDENTFYGGVRSW